MLNRTRSRLRQSGLSLVELMVGIAVGMFVVAAAATLVTTQLVDNRRLLQEVQLQQDLRATADIITRDLRRASATNKVTDAVGQMWVPDTLWVENSMLEITLAAPDSVQFRNGRDDGGDGPYGYELRQVDGVGVLYSRLGPRGWQPLTDGAVINITNFTVTARAEPDLVVPCPKLCQPGGTEDCWPRVRVRSYAINIAAQAVGDASIQRSFSSVSRIRNDRVTSDPANLPGFCPA